MNTPPKTLLLPSFVAAALAAISQIYLTAGVYNIVEGVIGGIGGLSASEVMFAQHAVHIVVALINFIFVWAVMRLFRVPRALMIGIISGLMMFNLGLLALLPAIYVFMLIASFVGPGMLLLVYVVVYACIIRLAVEAVLSISGKKPLVLVIGTLVVMSGVIAMVTSSENRILELDEQPQTVERMPHETTMLDYDIFVPSDGISEEITEPAVNNMEASYVSYSIGDIGVYQFEVIEDQEKVMRPDDYCDLNSLNISRGRLRVIDMSAYDAADKDYRCEKIAETDTGRGVYSEADGSELLVYVQLGRTNVILESRNVTDTGRAQKEVVDIIASMKKLDEPF